MLKNKLKEHTKNLIKNIPDKPVIIIGLSGGPDSVFLLYLLKALSLEQPITLIATHLDHEWRPESGRDVTFCQKLCLDLDIPLVISKAHELELSIKNNGSKEEIGRKLRRYFFEQTLQKYQGSFIALGHHLQDQQETFFLRLLRGTTLSGLHGMSNLDDRGYLRPLLNTPKQEILDYLNKNNIPYLTDPTNTSDQFLRNKIRKYIIPALHKCDSRFDSKFMTTIQSLKQEDNFLQNLAIKAFNQIFLDDKLDIKNFKILDLVIKKRVILYWLIQEKIAFSPSDNFIQEIIRFLESPQGGSHAITQHTTIIKKENLSWIKKSTN